MHDTVLLINKHTYMSIQTKVLWNVKSVYRNVQEECPAPSFVQSVKFVTRWGSTLLLLITTLTLDREREQPESPPINITWHTSTNKKHTMLNHWTDSQSRSKEESDHRINLEAWRSKIFQVSLIAAVEALPRNSLPLQHMRLHPLYQEGQCQWSGCQAVCHNLWDFLHHLQNDHKVIPLFANSN